MYELYEQFIINKEFTLSFQREEQQTYMPTQREVVESLVSRLHRIP